MKYTSALLGGMLLLAVACTKNKNNVYLQPHNDNRMMDSMHAMMAKMDKMHVTNNPEIDFPMMMMMHHKGAISMANLELQAGKDDSLKRTARKIIDEQQVDIQQFMSFLDTVQSEAVDMEFTMEQKANMDKMGKTADVQLITGDVDNDFATLMIVHHQAAVDNALSYQHHGGNPWLLKKAADIASSQTKEIDEMSAWLIAKRR